MSITPTKAPWYQVLPCYPHNNQPQKGTEGKNKIVIIYRITSFFCEGNRADS
jgi:hypothetical protein